MIHTPTTFVIGAGASASYGIPTAAAIFKASRNLTPIDDEYQLLLETRIATVGSFTTFLEDLAEHPTADSIDSFLQW